MSIISPQPLSIPSSSSLRPLYEESSQFRHWRFSSQKLAKMRDDLNERSVKIVRENVEAEKLAASSSSIPPWTTASSSSSSTTITPSASTDLSTIPYLTVSDELSLVNYYISLVPRTVQGFGAPEVVEATTISYIKRFYLWNTCMDYHPRKIMPTCLFLALKTENHLIPIDALISRFSKLLAAEVLQLEFLVAQSLQFEFACWHAHKALKGFWLDFQALPNTSIEELESTLSTAQEHVKLSRLIDLELTYTSSQIALAALHLSDPTLTSSYLSSKYPSSGSAMTTSGDNGGLAIELEELMGVLREIEMEIEDQRGRKVDMGRIKEVDRRLRLCSNPEKIVGSALHRKRKAEEEAEEEEKRAKKAEKARTAKAADEAIFGGVIIPGSGEGGGLTSALLAGRDNGLDGSDGE